MGVTAFLSMWINNSAATNIMIPTAIAIASELHNHQKPIKELVVSNEDDHDHDRKLLDDTSINLLSMVYIYFNIQIVN